MDADQSTPRLSGVAVFFYVFLPFALGHYLSSLLRNVNAVLAPQLVGALALTPGQLGLLTSAFFFAFALVQLPVGIALDRYGPRKVQLLLMLLAAVGRADVRATATASCSWWLARAIIGFGLGGCFMSAVKAISTWISPKKLPSVQGYLIAVGGLGAASATMPVRMALLQHTDWRGLFVLLALLSPARGALIWLVSPQRRAAGRQAADGALGARRLPHAGLPHHDLAGAAAACDLLRHPGPVDRALAVRRRALSRRRRGLPALHGHGRGDLRRDRGRHDHRVGGPARHDGAGRGGVGCSCSCWCRRRFVSATSPACSCCRCCSRWSAPSPASNTRSSPRACRAS
jgi:hypothetical protein